MSLRVGQGKSDARGEGAKAASASAAQRSARPLLLSRRAEGLGQIDGERAGRSVHSVLQNPGSPLDPTAQAAAERSLRPHGFDFGRVRIHNDNSAAESARSLGARAYTVGNHVVFGRGKYQPQSPSGSELLIHELGHVMQNQRSGAGEPAAVQPDSFLVSNPGSPQEQQANQLAKGQPVSFGSSTAVAGGTVIYRDLDPTFGIGIPAHDQDDENDFSLAALRRDALPAPSPAAPAVAPARDPSEWRLKDKELPAVRQQDTGFTAHEKTRKLDRLDGIAETSALDPDTNQLHSTLKQQRRDGVRHVVEHSEAKVTNEAGDTVVERTADVRKQFSGNRETKKVREQQLADGSRVFGGEEEHQEGKSNKQSTVFTTNKQADTLVVTVQGFKGTKDTQDGVAADGRFRESEVVDGTNVVKSNTYTLYKGPDGKPVGTEVVERVVKTTGKLENQLENVGFKYAALDLKRRERLKGGGSRNESSKRSTAYKSGATQQESVDTNLRVGRRGSLTTVETQRRLKNGQELKSTTKTSILTINKTGKATSTQYPGALGRSPTETERQSRDVTATLVGKSKDFTKAKPGTQLPSTVARPSTQILKVEDLGLVKKRDQYTDKDGKVVNPDTQGTSKAAYEQAAKEGRDGTYIERVHGDVTHVTSGDQAELTDGGAGVSGQKTVQHGFLDSFLRKDRHNFGWLAVEQVVSNSILVGSERTAKAGFRGQGDVAGATAGYSYLKGVIARSSVKQTYRVGPVYVSLELDQSSLAGAEGSVSGDLGWGKNAGYGLSANASAFAGARSTVGLTASIGIADVPIGTGAVHVRLSVGAGFTGKFDYRYYNQQFIMSGGVAAAIEAGAGADVEMRLNPAAIVYAIGKAGGQSILGILGEDRINRGQAAVKEVKADIANLAGRGANLAGRGANLAGQSYHYLTRRIFG